MEINESNKADNAEPVAGVSGPERYKKHRWKFLLFGAVSGVLMGVYAPGPTSPGSWIGDLMGGIFLWYIFWWLWARSKST